MRQHSITRNQTWEYWRYLFEPAACPATAPGPFLRRACRHENGWLEFLLRWKTVSHEIIRPRISTTHLYSWWKKASRSQSLQFCTSTKQKLPPIPYSIHVAPTTCWSSSGSLYSMLSLQNMLRLCNLMQHAKIMHLNPPRSKLFVPGCVVPRARPWSVSSLQSRLLGILFRPAKCSIWVVTPVCVTTHILYGDFRVLATTRTPTPTTTTATTTTTTTKTTTTTATATANSNNNNNNNHNHNHTHTHNHNHNHTHNHNHNHNHNRQRGVSGLSAINVSITKPMMRTAA